MKISVPAFERSRERFGGNAVVQLIEPASIMEVSPTPSDGKTLAVRGTFERRLVVFPKGERAPKVLPEYSLRCLTALRSIDHLDASAKLKWLSHVGATGPTTIQEIQEAWRDVFRFVSEDLAAGKVGLRTPQMGALHAIASHWTVSDEAATIVMPTGTGKTETMLATLVYCRCPRVLVVVPTDALRTQTFRKFSTLGCLREIGAVPATIPLPRVGFVRTGLRSEADARAFAHACNVLVATVSVLASSDATALSALAAECSHLFVDEAHHLAARTWNKVKALFEGKPVLQFTATPYRKDEKQIEGKIIYNYPLGRAQQAGYFKPIDLLAVEELDEGRADKAIAERAIERLEADLQQGLDHLVMARVDGIPRAKEVLAVYEKIGKKHKPVMIHSGLPLSESAAYSRQVEQRKSRILVCVNMFGEGFDLPQLKIAAMHDVHKSLPITLQFVGRFVRTANNVGNASVVVNLADPQVDNELQALYAEDPDWNALLRRSSEQRIAREMSLQEFVESFSGDLPQQIPLWNLRPGYSTVVYSTGLLWRPEAFAEALPQKGQAWTAASKKERIVIAVLAKQEDVRWGRYQNIKDHYWNLVVAHWSKDQHLLFIYASDYKVVNTTEIAKALCGSSASLVNGPRVFRVFSGIERPMVKNLGASKAGTISFTMYFGAEVSAGLSQVEKAESDLNNLFGWGYEDGERITQGCSARRGKLWSAHGGPVADWRTWCEGVGRKLGDESIQDAEVTKGFLRPIEVKDRPAAVPVAVEWGERILREDEERVVLYIAGRDYRLHEVDIRLVEPEDAGPIIFDIVTEDQETRFELRIGGGGQPPFSYRRLGANTVDVKIGGGNRMPFEQWCEADPVIISYADGSFSYNQFFVKAPCEAAFDDRLLVVENWQGTNIKIESEGSGRRADSVQFKIIEGLRDDFDVVFNDDDAGEAADIVALRKEGGGKVLLRLVHCKYSSKPSPGARIKDLYEVCGQAQKSVKWKHKGLGLLVQHMKRRERKWQASGHTRFIKGDFQGLRILEKVARHSRLMFEVTIVQPGLAKSQARDDILRLLGTTELLLKKTADGSLKVICSK